MHRTAYTPIIVEALGCDEQEACVVEELMRVEHPTLDHLSRARLASLARASKRDLDTLREIDPETARWYEKSAR